MLLSLNYENYLLQTEGLQAGRKQAVLWQGWAQWGKVQVTLWLWLGRTQQHSLGQQSSTSFSQWRPV